MLKTVWKKWVRFGELVEDFFLASCEVFFKVFRPFIWVGVPFILLMVFVVIPLKIILVGA